MRFVPDAPAWVDGAGGGAGDLAAARFQTLFAAALLTTGRRTVVGDNTVDGHTGRAVHGKARHRDPGRSSHACTAWS